jgi:DNA processing protein
LAPDQDFDAWFRLLETPGVGRETARRLLAACGSAPAVFSTPAATLRGLIGPQLAELLKAEPAPEQAARAAAARAWLMAAPDHHVVKLGDPEYPPRLLQTADPPLMLYLQGSPSALQARSVAVVGSRSATAQGIDNARAFGRSLAEQGLVVVSGLAAGIDAAAHEGALAARGTAADAPTVLTIAVVGTGLDRVYPPRNLALAQRIARHGALVSEYAPGTPPLPEHFPQRNRIIAGLSLGTLVVEAALRSGSLITARLASEAGREVFAIPGSIHAAQSRGCHALIKIGAKLVESAQDIFEEFAPTHPTQRALFDAAGVDAVADEARPHPEQGLLDALGDDPVTTDALVSRTGWPVSALATKLLELELQGLVARLPGGLYQRRHSG